MNLVIVVLLHEACVRIRPHPQLIYSLKRILIRLTGHSDQRVSAMFFQVNGGSAPKSQKPFCNCFSPSASFLLPAFPVFPALVTRPARSFFIVIPPPSPISTMPLPHNPKHCYYLSSHCIRRASCDFITLPSATWETIFSCWYCINLCPLFLSLPSDSAASSSSEGQQDNMIGKQFLKDPSSAELLLLLVSDRSRCMAHFWHVLLRVDTENRQE